MPILIAIMLLVGSLNGTPAVSAEPCFRFEPAPASIVGKLVRRTFPGPPEYEDTKKGDRPETYWFLELREPICVMGTPGDELNSENVNDVTLVQLILLHGEYKTHSQLVGKKVRATGTFAAGISGHHRTPVLLQVARLEREK